MALRSNSASQTADTPDPGSAGGTWPRLGALTTPAILAPRLDARYAAGAAGQTGDFNSYERPLQPAGQIYARPRLARLFRSWQRHGEAREQTPSLSIPETRVPGWPLLRSDARRGRLPGGQVHIHSPVSLCRSPSPTSPSGLPLLHPPLPPALAPSVSTAVLLFDPIDCTYGPSDVFRQVRRPRVHPRK